ncbi:MAG: DUF805 domain-containing protein [Acidimicrobiia bacterium]
MENIDWQDLLFKFDGRINRAKFWIGTGISWALIIVAVALAAIIGGSFGFLVAVLAYVAVIWIGLAVSIKRWHDRGKSGWWILIVLIPFIGYLWALIETGFLEGDKGDNQYGSDPLTA